MPTVFNSQLQMETLRLLRCRPADMTMAKISADTQLGKPWLEKFARSCGGSHSVHKVEKLYTYLSGKTLEL